MMDADRKMTDDQKRLFDSIFELYRTAWSQFNERRSYEFKISLSFWAALTAAIAGSLRLENLPGSRFTLILLSIFSFVLHWIWCRGIGEAQRAERKIAFFYERKLQALAGAEFDEDLRRLLDSLKETMGLLKNWTYRFQLGVTAFLGFALVIANWSRFGALSPFEIRALISLAAAGIAVLLISLFVLGRGAKGNPASPDQTAEQSSEQ